MNVLVIEESRSVAQIIASILGAYDYRVSIAQPADLQTLGSTSLNFEAIVMSTNLSKGRSTVFLKMIRSKHPGVYILGISTKATWKEKVEFLNAGADDVLDYPFPMQELLARIQSLLRRPKNNTRGILRLKNIEIDTDMKEVSVENKPVPLRRREYSLLEYMVKNKGRTIGRAELLDHVWDYRRSTGSNTVDVHVKRLRDKLKDREVIETVHGFGYTIRDQKKKTEETAAL
jgi:DNA-binding response OmpR family regulator